jgi:hypothetical protein
MMRCELPDGNRMAHGVVVGVSKAISCGTITTSSLVTTINEHRQTAKCVLYIKAVYMYSQTLHVLVCHHNSK